MTISPTGLRIGTRGSKLALIQTQMAIDAIKAVHPTLTITVVPIETTGDTTQKANIDLHKIGGKGLFADRLNAELEKGTVDALVHSMKDLPSIRPDIYTVAAMLARGDPRDVFLCNIAGVDTIGALPTNAIIGTSSPRRAAVARRMRPDLTCITFRGNVDTRLQKLRDGFEGVSATFLARAGLERLGLGNLSQTILEPDEFLPAAGQAAIGIEVMTENAALLDLLRPVGCAATMRCVTAERACLAILDGDCKTSIAAYATEEGGTLILRSEIYTEDGADLMQTNISGPTEEALQLGEQAGRDLLQAIPQQDHLRFNICA